MPAIPLILLAERLGTVLMTRSAARRLHRDDALDCLERHMIGDYGEVDDFDWTTNDAAWEHGFPVVSSYRDRRRRPFLIVTDADRSATTIMLPDEY